MESIELTIYAERETIRWADFALSVIDRRVDVLV
ncbi:Uncharacterised protein [Nocardia asteroides]|nr:hypothetical protein SAMN05444423_105133 [Nocardia asteroides]VEG34907.1 Uncharacterised protein [Nocardia asteroides]